MNEQQRTIKKEARFSGRGLHTGCEAEVILKPAREDTGIVFKRTDLPGEPLIRPAQGEITVDKLIPRCTSIGRGEATIYTVEHFMAVLFGLKIDNLLVEINGKELPGLDGSGNEFLNGILKVGIIEQSAPRRYIKITEPLCVHQNSSSLVVVPDEQFAISYVLSYDHPLLQAQFYASKIDENIFSTEIAPARTFCLEEEAEQLQASGLGKGADYTNTLVVGEKGVIKNTVRFNNEFARHKVLDLIGDLYLLGRPIRGRVFAVKSGHSLNLELLKKINQQLKKNEQTSFVPAYDYGTCRELDIQQVMKILPHRYPFLLVDKILELERGKKAIGIKNVTINDNFFTGHFPTRPIMPGVLMVEAMAQVGGVLVLTNGQHDGKVALFMATDHVKFRKPVVPGDQLHMEVEVLRDRSRTASLKGVARVGGDIVAEAEMVFSFIDTEFLNESFS